VQDSLFVEWTGKKTCAHRKYFPNLGFQLAFVLENIRLYYSMSESSGGLRLAAHHTSTTHRWLVGASTASSNADFFRGCDIVDDEGDSWSFLTSNINDQWADKKSNGNLRPPPCQRLFRISHQLHRCWIAQLRYWTFSLVCTGKCACALVTTWLRHTGRKKTFCWLINCLIIIYQIQNLSGYKSA
jgi:hypothetical protein